MSSRLISDAVSNFCEQIPKFKDSLVIAEGKKDKKALEALGFSKVLILNKPLYELAESIKEKRVLLLTDLDKEGKQIYSRIKKELSRQGIGVDDTLRNLLFRTELRQIEGLTAYLEKFV
jgi:5S rRNA maturation endonuclease (ribonuclease M5)